MTQVESLSRGEVLGLDESKISQIFSQLARQIHEKGLAAVAIFMLEMYKPFCGLICNFSLIALPFLLPLVGMERYQLAREFLNSSENIELLIKYIEKEATKA